MQFQRSVVGSGVAGVAGLVTRCRLHDDVQQVVGRVGEELSCGDGEHVVFKALQAGHRDCHAPKKVLLADQRFARQAVSMEIPGFAYLHADGLPGFKRYENGSALGVRAFGRGYCYVAMIRPQFRMRVARVLGPVSLLEDFLVMFRAAGLSRLEVQFRVVGPDLVHCEEAGGMREGRQVANELYGLLSMNPRFRIGVQSYGTMDSERVLCGVCKCIVKKDGHAARCRVPRLRRPVSELVGDALHSLDVKIAVVMALPVGSHYTEAAKRYVAASAQKEWLMRRGVVQLDAHASDHSWASEFEARYGGRFRGDYLCWLAGQFGLDPEALIMRCAEPEIVMAIDGCVHGSVVEGGEVGESWGDACRCAFVVVGVCVAVGLLLGVVYH